MFIYSIYDKKACVHRSQMVCSDDPEAVRAVARVANNGNSDLFLFSDDYAVYNLGELDVNTGAISGFTPVKFVCDVSVLIKTEKKEPN